MFKKTLYGIFEHLLELPWYVNLSVGIAFKVILSLYHAQLFPHELWFSDMSPYSLSEKVAAGALAATGSVVSFVFISAGIVGVIQKLRDIRQ